MKIKNTIVIIDYGLGNLNSVVRALHAARADAIISSDPVQIATCTKLILPGVGAFAKGMDGLKKRNLIDLIKEQVSAGKYLLGLCLGMHLLFENSEEFGSHQGLSLVAGTVKKLTPTDSYKIPHIGWNELIKSKGQSWKNTILADIKDREMTYFVHSFAPYPKDKNVILAETEYGGQTFCSVVMDKNIIGTQFHPEKSADVGQRILKRFINLV